MTTITMTELLVEGSQKSQAGQCLHESRLTMIRPMGELVRQIPVRWMTSRMREIPVTKSEDQG